MWKILIFNVLFCAVNCDLDCTKYQVHTDFGPEDCDNEADFYYNPTMYSDCIPGCEKVLINVGLPHDCSLMPCPPAYDCKEKQCVLDEDSCFKYVYKTGDYENARFQPKCLVDGTWAPKQCKGDRCFCYGPKGNRIFGDAFLNQASNMTCACSRKRAEMEEAKQYFFVSLHCDSMGNYEPLQCQDGNCWCVEPKTGELTAPVVPELMMSQLPCYDSESVGSQYFRQCESQIYAQAKIKDEYNAHGTIKINFGNLKCLYDGNFGPYKTEEGQTMCVWKDNSKIGSYAVAGENPTLTCNCARDVKIFELLGKQLMQACSPDGSYSPVQKDGDEYYCVDTDGYRKNDPREKPFDEEECRVMI
nr:uncharacterized protein LOC111417721 isoform X1 [Onthophagus taurus]